MTGLALSLFLGLSAALPAAEGHPLARTDRRLTHERLQVVTDDTALGEEMARAARPYLRSPGIVGKEASQNEAVLKLLLQREPAPGLRWRVTLSLGPAKVRRTLHLNGPTTRFDLAEAVAIGLPAMLDRLAQGTLPPPSRGFRPAAPGVPADLPEPAGTELAMVSQPHNDPPPADAERAPARDPAPAVAPPADPPPIAEPPPALVTPPPAVARPPAWFSPKVPPPRAKRLPAPALALVGGGAAVLLAGFGTGGATLVAAQQVNVPLDMMKFDHDLDRRGKALNTATIVLDACGAAALGAGGAWLIYHTLRQTPRQHSKAQALTLVPAPAPTGLGMGIGGRF